MAGESLMAGNRVARRLAEDVVRMDDSEGLRANPALSLLVGVGANQGLPMSTTMSPPVPSPARAAYGFTSSTRALALAWLATLPSAALIAATAFVVFS